MAKKKDNKTEIQTIIERTSANIAVNVEENYIFTTEDKVRILYDEYNNARKHSGDFLALLGIFLSLLVSILTCEFKDLPFMSAAVVEAAFNLATIISFFLCVCSGFKWIGARNKLKFDYFIKKLQGEDPDNKTLWHKLTALMGRWLNAQHR